MSKNTQRFAATMSDRMKQTVNAAAASSVVTDLGVVNSDYSITPSSLRYPIPKGEYLINLLFVSDLFTSEETHFHSGGTHGGHEGGDGMHTHMDGLHKHEMPPEYRNIRPGDRVLIVWCGNEPVVVAIVVSS